MLIQQAQLLKRLGLPGNVYVCPIHGARRMRNSDDSKGLTSFFDVQYTGKWSTNKAHLAEARANLCPYMRELYRDGTSTKWDCSVDPEIVTQIVTRDVTEGKIVTPDTEIVTQIVTQDQIVTHSDVTQDQIVTQIVTPPKALTHAERQKVYRARHKA